jgi:hypothetical protein
MVTAPSIGIGSTKTVAVIGVPAHPFSVGVMVKVTVMGEVVVLVKVPLISPTPLAAIPVTETVLFLVQLKMVESKAPDKFMVVIGDSEHIVCDGGSATAFGIGLMFIVATLVSSIQGAAPISV